MNGVTQTRYFFRTHHAAARGSHLNWWRGWVFAWVCSEGAYETLKPIERVCFWDNPRTHADFLKIGAQYLNKYFIEWVHWQLEKVVIVNPNALQNRAQFRTRDYERFRGLEVELHLKNPLSEQRKVVSVLGLSGKVTNRIHVEFDPHIMTRLRRALAENGFYPKDHLQPDSLLYTELTTFLTH